MTNYNDDQAMTDAVQQTLMDVRDLLLDHPEQAERVNRLMQRAIWDIRRQLEYPETDQNRNRALLREASLVVEQAERASEQRKEDQA